MKTSDLSENIIILFVSVLLVAKLVKTGTRRWIRFSESVTPVHKPKYFIVYWFVVRKNLSQCFEIRFHFPEIYISKTCVK